MTDPRTLARELVDVLDQLGVEASADTVLDVWRDRVLHGQDPLPVVALRRLAGIIDQELLDRITVPRRAAGAAPNHPQGCHPALPEAACCPMRPNSPGM